MIETARLRLRPGFERDVDGLVAALNDWTVAQWLIQPPYPYRAEDARQFIRATASEDGIGGRYIIADRGTDALLGVVGLTPSGGRVELGYWLCPVAQRQGYMREAAAASLGRAARRAGGVHTVFATTDPDNLPSQAVLLALGFERRGEQARPAPSRRNHSVLRLFEAPLAGFA
jgi:RimJ/RimL family protein N-acetyltransferase